MSNIRYTLPLIAFFPLAAIAADKHVHGEAEMFIAIEKKQVLIELESPADNILGFEHAPKTKEQHQLLDSSIEKLKSYTSLVSFSTGSCKQVDADIKAPFEEHHGEGEHGDHHADEHGHKEHGHDKHKEHAHDDHEEHEHEHEKEEHEEHGHEGHDHADHGDEDGHSEFHTSYTLACSENMEKTLTATINAFKTFSGFEKIQVNWVTSAKQGSSKATPAKASVTIE